MICCFQRKSYIFITHTEVFFPVHKSPGSTLIFEETLGWICHLRDLTNSLIYIWISRKPQEILLDAKLGWSKLVHFMSDKLCISRLLCTLRLLFILLSCFLQIVTYGSLIVYWIFFFKWIYLSGFSSSSNNSSRKCISPIYSYPVLLLSFSL